MYYLNRFKYCFLFFFLFGFGQTCSATLVHFQNSKIQNISSLYTLSDSLSEIFEFESAKNLNIEILRTIKIVYGSKSQEVVFGLYKLANCEFGLGEYINADSLLSDAVKIQNQIDSLSLMSGRLLYKKSEIGNILCDCKEIIPIAEKAVILLENHLGEYDPEVAYALDVYGYVLAHDYQYDKSIELHNRSLKILEEAYGIDSKELSRTLCFLSRIYLILYDIDNGMPYIERALRLVSGEDIDLQKRLAEILYFKTYLLYVTSDYEKAEKTSIESIEILTNLLGEKHPKTAEYSTILSRIYLKLGKYELAEPLMLRIKNIYEKTYGYDYPLLYYSFVNLGELYIAQGRFKEAEYYFTQCLLIPNIKESFRIGILTNLSEIYLELDQLEKAENRCIEVITFRTNQLGKNNPIVALSLKLLAKVYTKQNKFKIAENTYIKVYEIFKENYGENSLYIASTLQDLAELYCKFHMPQKSEDALIQAIKIRKEKLLPGNPLVANSYLDLAVAQLNLGKTDSSYKNMIKGLYNRREFITHVFTYTSSEQKLLYTKDHPLIYNPLLIIALKSKSQKIIESASDMIIQGKAFVIDALSINKEISTCKEEPGIAILVNRYSDVCTQIAAVALATRYNEIKKNESSSLETLYKTRDSLEAELSLYCSNFEIAQNAQEISTFDVAAKLPDSSLYIDYIKFNPSLEDNSISNYLALVVDKKRNIKIIDLGDADEIDRLIFDLRKKIKDSKFQIYSEHSGLLEKQLQELTFDLYCRLIKPIESSLIGKQKLLIAPDSDLNLVPFEIFSDEKKQYLIEKYEICYLSSGRDMIQKIDDPTEVYDLIVLASPDFDSKNKSQQFIQSTSVSKRISTGFSPQRSMISQTSCFENSFSPLVYSKDEGQQLINLFKKNYINEKALLYYNKDATSTILSQLQRPPRYVHLSTHGFFCQDNSEVYLKNPLLRSGLAFTGANFKIDSETRMPFTFDDGLLTALEVTGLNLVGTELVTLSACETGIGETVSGEGVFGLRRAFQIAGAKSILMSMWKIPDKETSDLMLKFYTKLFSGSSKQKALRDSALETLQELRKKYKHGHPYLWGGFILTGSPN